MNDYNTLQNIDLSAIEAKRIRTIGYKNDGNTPCKHYYDAHPLDKVLEDTSFKGLYLALIEKPYQDGGTDYNGGFYMVFNDLGENIFTEFKAFYGHDPIEQMAERLHGMECFIGKDGFLSHLAYTAALGRAVKNPELMALDMLGETELAKSYRKKKSVWLAKREQEEKERKEQYRKEQEAKQRRREEEKHMELETAANKIRNRERTPNDNGVILDLMRKYGVNVPLRTQGWILDCLISVTFNDDSISYTYLRRNKGRGSQKIYDCLHDLVSAIDAEKAVIPHPSSVIQ